MLYYNTMMQIKRSAVGGLRPWFRRLVDKVGASLSAICALHCLIAPWLLVLSPGLLLALHSHRHPQHHLASTLMWFTRWEWLIALLASLVAMASTLVGYLTHGKLRPAGLALLGSTLLILTTWVPALGQSVLLHTLGTVLGGGCLVQAHLTNLRLHRVIALVADMDRR